MYNGVKGLNLSCDISFYYVMNCDEDSLGASLNGTEQSVRKPGLQTTGYLCCTSHSVYLLPLTSSCSSPDTLYLRGHSAEKKVCQHETLFAFLYTLNKNPHIYMIWTSRDMSIHRLKLIV